MQVIIVVLLLGNLLPVLDAEQAVGVFFDHVVTLSPLRFVHIHQFLGVEFERLSLTRLGAAFHAAVLLEVFSFGLQEHRPLVALHGDPTGLTIENLGDLDPNQAPLLVQQRQTNQTDLFTFLNSPDDFQTRQIVLIGQDGFLLDFVQGGELDQIGVGGGHRFLRLALVREDLLGLQGHPTLLVVLDLVYVNPGVGHVVSLPGVVGVVAHHLFLFDEFLRETQELEEIFIGDSIG